MRNYTFRAKGQGMTHTELVAAAKLAAGVGEWEITSVEWYGDDNDTRATVELFERDTFDERLISGRDFDPFGVEISRPQVEVEP